MCRLPAWWGLSLSFYTRAPSTLRGVIPEIDIWRVANLMLKRYRPRRGNPAGTRRWQPRMPEQLDEEEVADSRAGRNAIYQLAALTIGARLAVAEA